MANVGFWQGFPLVVSDRGLGHSVQALLDEGSGKGTDETFQTGSLFG